MSDVGSSPVHRSRRSNGDQTYRDLVDAALWLWSEGGVQKVTMNAVATRAGRTRGTVYHHFADREALVAAVRTHLDETLSTLFSEIDPERGNPYLVVAELAAESPDLVQTYLQTLLARNPNRDPLLHGAIDFFRKLDRGNRLVSGVDADHVAMIVVAMWFAATLTVALGDTPEERRDQSRRFARTFEHMMNRSFLRTVEDG